MDIRKTNDSLKILNRANKSLRLVQNILFAFVLFISDCIFPKTMSAQTYTDYLIETNWHQERDYNVNVPTWEYGLISAPSKAGCGAIAVAQILNYFQYPNTPTGNIQYPIYNPWANNPSYQTINENLNQFNFSWTPELDETEIADLVFCSGIAQYTNYKPKLSGSRINDIRNALSLSFQYQNQILLYSRSDPSQNMVSKQVFLDHIAYNINLGSPVILRATDLSNPSVHFMIIDGYIENTDIVHVNVGWKDGSFNTWYSIDNINPGDHIYDDHQYILTNIWPADPGYILPQMQGSENEEQLTRQLLVLPCPQMIYPAPLEDGVTNEINILWEEVENSIGYKVTIEALGEGVVYYDDVYTYAGISYFSGPELLPANDTISVTINPIDENGIVQQCPAQFYQTDTTACNLIIESIESQCISTSSYEVEVVFSGIPGHTYDLWIEDINGIISSIDSIPPGSYILGPINIGESVAIVVEDESQPYDCHDADMVVSPFCPFCDDISVSVDTLTCDSSGYDIMVELTVTGDAVIDLYTGLPGINTHNDVISGQYTFFNIPIDQEYITIVAEDTANPYLCNDVLFYDLAGCSGCTDSLAHNYNPYAEVDDGSCQTCTDGILNGDESSVDCGGDICPPCNCEFGNITLSSQEEVDNFIGELQDCGDVTIESLCIGYCTETEFSDITSLAGLENIGDIGILSIQNNPGLQTLISLQNASVNSRVEIINNDGLSNLQGLEGVDTLFSTLWIMNNDSLQTLQGLENLVVLQNGDLLVESNLNLSSLDGLESLYFVGNNLQIQGNSSLIDLSGLSTLEVINGNLLIENNTILPSLSGLQNVTTFDGLLRVCNNAALTSLLGLNGLTSLGGQSKISNNNSLSSLFGLDSLDTIDYLSISGNTNLISISDLNIFQSASRIDIINNDALISIDGLNDIDSIGALIVKDNNELALISSLNGIQSITFIIIENNPALTSIDGMTNLEIVIEYLRICNNPSLISLIGLSSLQEIGGGLFLEDNQEIQTLNGLHNVESIGGPLSVLNNFSLITLNDLGSISSIDGNLNLDNNDGLTTLDGLDNLNSVGGSLFILNHDALISIEALENVASVNGEISLLGNTVLQSLNGLDNIDPLSISELTIMHSNMLSECAVTSVCEYLSNMENPFSIGFNAQGCDFVGEILDDCICPDGTQMVTNTNDIGIGSLRKAIECLNYEQNLDSVHFNIPGSGPHIIQLQSPLPSIIDANVIIDGSTQPGYYPGIIELRADSSGVGEGLLFHGDGGKVYGLKFVDFSAGVRMNVFSGSVKTVTVGAPGKGNIFENNTHGIAMYGQYAKLIAKSNLTFSDTLVQSTGFHLQSDNNIIGGELESEGNSFTNLWTGVAYASSNSENNWLRKNLFSCNYIPIYENGGATNIPIIFGATDSIVLGASVPDAIIEIYYSDTSGCTSFPCQGETYLGTTISDENGEWMIEGDFIAGLELTALAKAGTLHTSLFSECVVVGSIVSGCTDSTAHNFNPLALIDDGSCQTCNDGMLNGDETGIDCGGTICQPCACLLPDRETMITLYIALNGNEWESPWDTSECNYCTWPGVLCNGSSEVVGINLTSDLGLGGHLPTEIGNLSKLVSLGIYNSALTDTIPSSIGNLTFLENLKLSSNNIVGSIPASIGNLSNLEHLDLSHNQMSGSIPTSLGNLNSLIDFRLNHNNLTGTLPPELAMIMNPSLGSFSLNDNELEGCFPASYDTLCLPPLEVELYNNPGLPGSGSDFYLFCEDGTGICIPGCMDTSAHNYNPLANIDDGSCETCDDGIQNGDEADIDCGGDLCMPCTVAQCHGDTISLTLNDFVNGIYLYPAINVIDSVGNNTLAIRRIGSCIDFDWTTNGACLDQQPNGVTNSNDLGSTFKPCLPIGMCDTVIHFEVRITDPMGNNTFCTDTIYIFIDPTVYGCTDSLAHNYNPEASIDDGSCETCTDSIQNGDEIAIDCGGELCLPCAPDYSISTSGDSIIITNVSGDSETMDVTQSGADIRFEVNNRTYSLNGADPVSFPANILLIGIVNIEINAGGGNDTINVDSFSIELPGLTINGGTGNDIVNMIGDIAFMLNSSLELDLQNDSTYPGADRVTIGPMVNLNFMGSGQATIKVSRNIFIDTESIIETENGDIIFEANQQSVSTEGNFYGIEIKGGLVHSTGSGKVTVKGEGGNSSTKQYGVYVHGEGQISGGSQDTAIIVEGRGGLGSGNNNHGLYLTGMNTGITSLGGNVYVLGYGSNAGVSQAHIGIKIDSSSIISAGVDGTLSVEGIGGIGSSTVTGGGNNGIVISTGATITTDGGNINLIGNGGGIGFSTDNSGVHVGFNGSISAGGCGTVNVEGNGGNSSGSYNWGVSVAFGNSKITSECGSVTVVGQGGGVGAGAKNYGIYVQSSGSISAGGLGATIVQGVGGYGSGSSNYGVYISGSNATINSDGGNVSVNGQGGGSGMSTNNHGIFVQGSGLISAGDQGEVMVSGVGGGVGGNNNYGILVNGAMITSSGGNVFTTGTGGNTTSSGNMGVYTSNSGVISSGGNGAVNVLGHGGGTHNSNYGVFIQSTNSAITSTEGAVNVVGFGGGLDSSINNYGIYVLSGSVTAGGPGNLTVTGVGGGLNGANSNFGVLVYLGGIIKANGSGNVIVEGIGGAVTGTNNIGVIVAYSNATITSNGGNVDIIGSGGSTSEINFEQFNDGVYVQSTGMISAGSVGLVTIEGTAGGDSGIYNRGIVIVSSAKITSSGGDILLKGVESALGIGIENSNSGQITTAENGGNITLVANSMKIDAIVSADTSSAIYLHPFSNEVLIDMGYSEDPIGGPLCLSNSELNNFTSGSLIIGNENSGSIIVSSDITLTGFDLTQFFLGDEMLTVNPGVTFNISGIVAVIH